MKFNLTKHFLSIIIVEEDTFPSISTISTKSFYHKGVLPQGWLLPDGTFHLVHEADKQHAITAYRLLEKDSDFKQIKTSIIKNATARARSYGDSVKANLLPTVEDYWERIYQFCFSKDWIRLEEEGAVLPKLEFKYIQRIQKFYYSRFGMKDPGQEVIRIEDEESFANSKSPVLLIQTNYEELMTAQGMSDFTIKKYWL